jgi:DNA-binding CsgD family transcriptional regulator
MKKQVIVFGFLMGILFAVLEFVEFKHMLLELSIATLSGLLAVIFTGLGVWLGKSFCKRDHLSTGAVIDDPPDQVKHEIITRKLKELKICPREHDDVLKLMAHGYSNRKIVKELFISLSTVKTHSSKIFSKLDVQRRTHAVKKANELSIILASPTKVLFNIICKNLTFG